jgi:peptidoglycan/LPS O-acetylase OafA/YrhL
LNKPQSLVSIDILRALAALGVFYYHQHIGSLMAHYTGLKWLSFTDDFGAVYAVPLFFLISGYCIHLSNIKYLKNNEQLPIVEYYKRRFLRIYPPYLVALVFSIAVNFITNTNDQVTKADFFTHLFLLQGFTITYFNSINVVLWTISIEMAFYILYPIFYYVRQRFSLNHAVLFALLVSCFSIIYFSLQANISNPERFCVFNIWFAWCCGAFLADKMVFKATDLKRPACIIIYSVVLLAFVLLKVYPQPQLVVITYQLDILIWMAPMILLLQNESWFSGKKNLPVKILGTIGLSSYSLYLFHYPLIALKNYWAHQFLPAKFQPAGVLIGFLIIPVITWFSYLYIERPFMAKKRKILVNV